jgi:enterochelin esterase family protein
VDKLIDLQRRLRGQADPDRILAAFVAENTFPLVQADTATFFFYDGHEAEEVRLMHWVFGLESSLQFRPLPGTKAWYLPVELPHAGRVEYKFCVRRQGRDIWMRDPHNPLRAFDPFGSNSVCPMPGYQPPTWVDRDPAARTGKMERFVIASKVYGDERPIEVYLPGEYSESKTYPLLIVHDGTDYRQFASYRNVLDNLIFRHEVAPLIVAFTSGHARNAEYGADPRQPKFIVEEVLAEMVARYPISADPHDRGLCGASFGAVSSLYTAWTYPGVFRRLLLQSGSFVFTDVGHHGRGPLWDPVVRFVNQFRADPGRINARVFMSCGTFEGLITYNRSLVPLMRQAGLDLRFIEASDGHNWIAWRDRLREGLTYLFPGYLWMTYE